MIPFIIGGAVGFLVSELIKPSKKTEQTDTKPFFVFIRSDENDKYTLTFYTYEDAKKVYDSVIQNKSIRYNTIIKNSDFEKELYDSGIEKGWTKKDGMKFKGTEIKAVEASFGKDSDEFESKTNIQ